MKNINNSGRKGYFTALFSFVCLAVVVAGVGFFNQADSKKRAQENAKLEAQEYERVDSNKNAGPKPQIAQQQTEEEFAITNEEPKEEVAAVDSKPEPIAETASVAVTPEVAFDEGVDYEETANFDNDLKLEWPVAGDIVMDYSIDQAIYDVTLDQYRTNDSVCISAEVGKEIKSAGAGVVEFVGKDNENGETVVINHNNGWKTTYSQLGEDVAVNVGDNVKAGQTIGSIGNPTIYGVGLGSHLDFKVTRDDQSIDPKVALAE